MAELGKSRNFWGRGYFRLFVIYLLLLESNEYDRYIYLYILIKSFKHCLCMLEKKKADVNNNKKKGRIISQQLTDL